MLNCQAAILSANPALFSQGKEAIQGPLIILITHALQSTLPVFID